MQISFAVTAKLISTFVFATWIVQFLYFLNPKFPVSSHLLWLHSPVCVGPGRKPRRPVFSQRGSNKLHHEKHYDNTPMNYIVIFHGCKNGNFLMKKNNIFLIFAQNIDCGYTLEPPQVRTHAYPCKRQFY